MTEGIQTTKVQVLYCAAVPIISHTAHTLMFSQCVCVCARTHGCNVLSCTVKQLWLL